MKTTCKNDFVWDSVKILDHASVPILALTTKNELKVEIQLNSEQALRSTLFLRNVVMVC